MGDIIDNKIWIDGDTCLTMAESVESFVDELNEYAYDKKGPNNTIIIPGLGRVHLPKIETYPLYFKGVNSDPRVWADYFVCTKEDYITAVNQEIDRCKRKLNYYEELLDIAKGEK